MRAAALARDTYRVGLAIARVLGDSTRTKEMQRIGEITGRSRYLRILAELTGSAEGRRLLAERPELTSGQGDSQPASSSRILRGRIRPILANRDLLFRTPASVVSARQNDPGIPDQEVSFPTS